jgi:AcrR family transcriptional regulator/DNA-binding MarR family transcriptional regulator
VEEIQRIRVLLAMADEVAMRGASGVTVARVIARAGVSRRLFYELFADVEDCLLATFDWAIEQMRTPALGAYSAERNWREGIRAGLAVLLRFFDEHPVLAQLCIVHAPGGGSRVLERRSQVIAELCAVVARGGLEPAATREPGPVVAEGVVGAVIAVLYTRLLARGGGGIAGYAEPGPEEPGLIELHGELTSLILLPYMGASAAGRELQRPAPPPRAPLLPPEREPTGRSMLGTPGSRLTYRTVRVLQAIADLPAASNREVAERAGIVDQGQISKILSRLEEQGLVDNRGGSGPARGTPNSWWLTERGETLERELRRGEVGEGSAGERPRGESARAERESRE